MYVHALEIRHFRRSRGQPSRNAIPPANTAHGWVSVLSVSSSNYFELPLTARKRLPSIWRNVWITPPPPRAAPYADFPISLARKFLGWSKNSGRRKFHRLLDIIAHDARNNSPRWHRLTHLVTTISRAFARQRWTH